MLLHSPHPLLGTGLSLHHCSFRESGRLWVRYAGREGNTQEFAVVRPMCPTVRSGGHQFCVDSMVPGRCFSNWVAF